MRSFALLCPRLSQVPQLRRYTRHRGAMGEGNEANRVLKIGEKRLGVNLWGIEGKNYKGGHSPVVFVTKAPCRRSPDTSERRRVKEIQSKWSAWTQ